MDFANRVTVIDKIDMGPKTFTDTIQLKGVGIYLAF